VEHGAREEILDPDPAIGPVLALFGPREVPPRQPGADLRVAGEEHHPGVLAATDLEGDGETGVVGVPVSASMFFMMRTARSAAPGMPWRMPRDIRAVIPRGFEAVRGLAMAPRRSMR